MKNPIAVGRFALFVLILAFVLSCAPTQITPPVTPPTRPAKIALVLGAGASRGFAHVGVIKVLEANRIPIHMVVGTSAGSFVGSLYAYGYSSFELQDIAMKIERGDVADFTLFGSGGFLKGEKLRDFVNRTVKQTPIERFKIPYHAIATDIQSGEERVFSAGDAGAAVRASCTIPGVFMPAPSGGRFFVDGGVVSPIAVDAARKLGADMVIAVDISSERDQSIPEGAIDTILQSIDIMYSHLSEAQLGRADIVIKPNVGRISSSDFTKRHDAVLAGEKAAYDALPMIANAVSAFRAAGRL